MTNANFEEFNQNQGLFSDINRENSSDSVIQSILRLISENEGTCDNVEGDYPYQGIFTRIDSVNSENSVNRNGSSLSSNSVLINEYRKELRDYYLNHKNEPMTNPFSSNLSEEEKKILFEVDKEIKASLSINSNKDNAE
ncbi:hypothetical protein BCR36DRAFT_398036 [Piromyces finnis]|uniref:Uncharacterized protein n=1 Tax=Piromyces finnis TaxID=1754191 RepID=A0A1Y1V7C8_9FUNG|nr:hypothetical protein BCR36DRAFT_398036 [Piromyces finnis]|eukprot:ORX49007.1 hypothetical protein BCR36DRAFT_398036 [Piromyces finnis]